MLAPHLEDARRAALDSFERAPFMTAAFVSALDMARDHPTLRIAALVRVPILTVINAMDPAGIEGEIERHIAAGYGTPKAKVGFNSDSDLKRVRLVRRLRSGRTRLRLDANQGYSAAEGCRFAGALEPTDLEPFEQPCAAEDWDAAIGGAVSVTTKNAHGAIGIPTPRANAEALCMTRMRFTWRTTSALTGQPRSSRRRT